MSIKKMIFMGLELPTSLSKQRAGASNRQKCFGYVGTAPQFAATATAAEEGAATASKRRITIDAGRDPGDEPPIVRYLLSAECRQKTAPHT